MPLESLTGDFPLCSQHDLHPRVDILLITHNGRHHLERLLPSLRRTKYKNYRLFLLDNASTDGSGDLVRQFYPDFVHLPLSAVACKAGQHMLYFPLLKTTSLLHW